MFRGIKRQIGTLGTMAIGLIAVVLGCLPAASSFAQIPCRYEVTAIIQGPFCGPYASPTLPTGISPNGRYVCGFYSTCAIGADRSFVYDVETAQMIVLPLPPGVSESAAYDVNDAGLAVGGMGGSAGNFGFIYDVNAGQYVKLIPPAVATGDCDVYAINASGKVCGARYIGVSPPLVSAFTWSVDEGVIDLGLINGKNTKAIDLNDSGTVTGTLFVGSVEHVMIWKEGIASDLGSPSKFDSRAGGINAQEQIGGGWVVQPSPILSRPGIWASGNLTELPLPAGFASAGVVDINASGACVGRCQTANYTGVACVWVGQEYAILDDLTQLDGLVSLEIARGVSDTGRVVADCHLLSGFDPVAVVLTPVATEPTDIDMNCIVDIDDLLAVIEDWGKTKSAADINHDGVVNVIDLVMVLNDWTT